MACVERILIVGGGISGLSLATALSQHGIKVELIERNPAWHSTGAGIFLHANGVRMLQTLGLAEAVKQAGEVLPIWRFSDQQGDVLYEVDLPALWGEVGPCIGIARPVLQQILLSGAASVPCRLGTTITAVTQDDQGVTVSFSDGQSDTYDLIVGADGITSTVRRLTQGQIPIGYTEIMNWRSIVPARPSNLTGMQILIGDGCIFGMCPLDEGHTYAFGAINSPRIHDPLSGRLERFRQHFAAFGGPVPEYLAALSSDEQIHCGPIEWVEPEQWYTGRAVLIGDAVHAGPPNMAEGGCLAMEGACVLAEALSSADSVEDALASYVARCRPRAEWVQQQSLAMNRGTLLPPTVRNAALRERGLQMMYNNFAPLMPPP